MFQNIKNNYHRGYKIRPYNDEYFDFTLYGGEIYEETNFQEKLAVDIDYNSIKGDKLYSHNEWVNGVNDNVELYDIGLTATDNGFISYEKDKISNKEFLDLLVNSTLKLDNKKLCLTQVTGNTQDYIYPIEFNETEKYISLKGGFYQGFFKVNGSCYEVLPSSMEEELNINISLRPRSDYSIEEGTINDLHPENNGFFFYIGTRAENKFYPFYDVDEDSLSKLVKSNTSNDGYMEDGDFVYNGVVHDQYMGGIGYSLDVEGEETNNCDTFFLDDYFNGKAEVVTYEYTIVCNPTDSCDNYNKRNDYITDDDYLQKVDSDVDDCNCNKSISEMRKYNETDNCLCGDYFGGYLKSENNGESYFDSECNDTGNFLPSEYIEEEVEINPEEIYNSEGQNYTKKGYYQIKTDNKFILFNRTETGFTVNNWDRETEEVILTGRTDWDNYNYHLLMNRTDTGYTVNTIHNFNETNKRKYNIYKDIVNNALGFRIKNDGSIGYRYATYDCENDDKYGIIEEYSKPNMINDNEWSKVHIKICPMGEKMKIMIYVNGNLVLISKELVKLNLRGLNDNNEKQEGVPYNISLGGGTQGLLEAIYPDYYNQPQFIMPLERDFCGTFLGDIKGMKIICGFLDYFLIKNYL